MRMIVTGIRDGRSCVVEDKPIEHAGEDLSTIPVMEFDPAALPPRPEGSGKFVDIPVQPGKALWYRVRFPANQLRPTHHTDTIDCHTIVAGSIELLLDDGAHLLQAGDSAVVNGVDHGWRIGPEGCTVSMMIFGTPRP